MSQSIGSFLVPVEGSAIVVSGLAFTPQRLFFTGFVNGNHCKGYAEGTAISQQRASRAYVVGGEGVGSYNEGQCLHGSNVALSLASLDAHGFTLSITTNPTQPTPVYFLAESD